MFTFTRFSQNDPDWKLNHLGFSSSTIGGRGCLLTDLAMIATGFGYNENPATLAVKLKALGSDVGFTGENVYPSALGIVLTGVFCREFLECHTFPAPLDKVDTALANGWPVIVEVDGKPAESGLQSHWVLLYGKQGNDYLMHDPWPYPTDTSAATLKTSPYKTTLSLEGMIETIVLMEGPQVPVIPVVHSQIPAGEQNLDGGMTVYATGDFLAFRSRPAVSEANLIRRVMENTPFTVIEPDVEAVAKIGRVGVWLKVKDAGGTKGFVAAEFVTLTPPVSTQPVVVTPPAPAPVDQLIVTVNTPALALRSKPLLSVETFMRYIASGADLVVIEPSAGALKKIGVLNQWIQVRTAANEEGFVAAWMVKKHV